MIPVWHFFNKKRCRFNASGCIGVCPLCNPWQLFLPWAETYYFTFQGGGGICYLCPMAPHASGLFKEILNDSNVINPVITIKEVMEAINKATYISKLWEWHQIQTSWQYMYICTIHCAYFFKYLSIYQHKYYSYICTKKYQIKH